MKDRAIIANRLKEEIELEYRDFIPLYLTLYGNNVCLVSCKAVKSKSFIF